MSGFGSFETNRSDPGFSIDSQYEDPQFLNRYDTVTLSAAQIGVSNGTKLLSHLGQAQFGRLRARALTLNSIFQETDLSTSVSIGMEVEDLVTPQNLNPATVRALRFDVELHGEMIKISNTVGEGAFATFALGLREANGAGIPCLGFTVEFN